MKRVNFRDDNYESVITALGGRGEEVPEGITRTVAGIVEDVQKRGDAALAEYTLRFDRIDIIEVGTEVSRELMEKALDRLPPGDRDLLEEAAESVRSFHIRQIEKTWTYSPEPGVELGQKVTPVGRVGLYVPGGTAAYPSSVLMNALPARVAGVPDIIMAVPSPEGALPDAVLAAALISGVDRVFRIGGAQAVAAMAYGTETVPRVDKIVGPGNIYVALAKKAVFGVVDIDMVAGPSEILVLADAAADPVLVAADLLSQAEHDALAYPVLITDDDGLLSEVGLEIQKQIAHLPRKEIAEESIRTRGYMILVPDLAEGARVANIIAPEHLELMVEDPDEILAMIDNAGAIFLGSYTPEALGDYMAGPNHVLPTGGTARFSSPLGVYDFLKRSSLIRYNAGTLANKAEKVARFARMEGLEAHARAVEMRFRNKTE